MITGYTRSGGLRYSHFITNIKIYIGGRNDEDRKATSELCIMGVRIGTTAHGIVKMAHLRICAFPPPDLPPAAGFPAAYLDISSFFFPPPWTHLSSAHRRWSRAAAQKSAHASHLQLGGPPPQRLACPAAPAERFDAARPPEVYRLVPASR